MFGYLQVQKSELLVREFEAYKSVYCGLCKQLKKDYSFLSSFILSYDCTFYALLLMSMNKSCSGFKEGRCKFNVLKKCKYAQCEDISYNKAAAFSVISAYYKIKDDITDSGFFKRNICRIILPFFSHWRKKAKSRYNDFDIIVQSMMQQQIADEKSESSTVDSSAHPTAQMLADILSLEAKNDKDKRVFKEFGYHIGRWIYLIDAADDIKKDKKSKNFNIFIKRGKDSDIKYISSVLSQSLARAYDVYNLMEISDFKGILDNMLLKGLPTIQNKVLRKSEDNYEISL